MEYINNSNTTVVTYAKGELVRIGRGGKITSNDPVVGLDLVEIKEKPSPKPKKTKKETVEVDGTET